MEPDVANSSNTIPNSPLHSESHPPLPVGQWDHLEIEPPRSPSLAPRSPQEQFPFGLDDDHLLSGDLDLRLVDPTILDLGPIPDGPPSGQNVPKPEPAVPRDASEDYTSTDSDSDPGAPKRRRIGPLVRPTLQRIPVAPAVPSPISSSSPPVLPNFPTAGFNTHSFFMQTPQSLLMYSMRLTEQRLQAEAARVTQA